MNLVSSLGTTAGARRGGSLAAPAPGTSLLRALRLLSSAGGRDAATCPEFLLPALVQTCLRWLGSPPSPMQDHTPPNAPFFSVQAVNEVALGFPNVVVLPLGRCQGRKGMKPLGI